MGNRHIAGQIRAKKVLLLHNVIAPYRLPLFEKLNEECDLQVYFCRSKTKKRLWAVSLKKCSFKARILNNMTIGPFILNPLLPFDLLFHRFDVYIVAENRLQTLFPISIVFLATKLFGKPFIVWSGAIDSNYAERSHVILKRASDFLMNKYQKLLYRHAESFIAYGNRAKRFLTERGADGKKVFVGTQVTNREPTGPEPVKKEEFGLEGKKIILFLGYFEKRKGVDLLINAFKNLNRNDSVLVIAGAGKEEDNLKSLASDRPDIRFTGYIAGQEKATYYSVADVFVSPTLHDPWSQVINEAMSYGLPIITTEADGNSEELIKDNGLVVKAGDENALKNALEDLLNNDGLRERMGQKSREYAKHYNLDYAVKCFRAAIAHAIQARGKGAK